ncbi:MAG: hypothetical protein V4592_19180 [Bacteroidota bacterium]
MLNRYLLLFIISAFICSCNNSPKLKQGKKDPLKLAPTPNATIENFDKFFKRYQIDSAFQISRTIFPLKYIVTGDEGENDSTKYIAKSKVGFNKMFISNKGKMVLRKERKGPDKCNVVFQIQDTGFQNDFMFELKDNKWYLAYVADHSD